MHYVFRVWQHIPCAPKRQHFFPSTKRDPNVSVHGGKTGANQNFVFTKMFNHILSRMEGIHHYKIGMRINRLKGASHCLIEKLLTVVRVLLNEGAHSIGVVQRSGSRSGGYRVNVVFGGEPPQLLNDFR
jgi:hypothetical protein